MLSRLKKAWIDRRHTTPLTQRLQTLLCHVWNIGMQDQIIWDMKASLACKWAYPLQCRNIFSGVRRKLQFSSGEFNAT